MESNLCNQTILAANAQGFYLSMTNIMHKQKCDNTFNSSLMLFKLLAVWHTCIKIYSLYKKKKQ